jgi:cell division protein ZapA (FtsZ GTPase activity inhibitor)
VHGQHSADFGKVMSSASDQIVTIELFGQPYTFKAESEVKEAKEVAEILVKEVDKIQNQQTDPSSTMSNLTILILAALNIANENMELKRNRSRLLDEISERSTGLIRRLDEIML